jgi:hypothetical protein
LRRGYEEWLNSRRSDELRKAALTDANRFEVSLRLSNHQKKTLEGYPSMSLRRLGYFRREGHAVDQKLG